MTNSMLPISLALGSSMCFASASLVYRRFSRQVAPQWMNAFKSTIATLAFTIVLLATGQLTTWPSLKVVLSLMLSGCVGLCVGDFFLMRSYSAIGAGRTLMIFAFNPIFLAVAGKIFLGHELNPRIALAVLSLSCCVLILGHESFLAEKRWNLGGYFQAILAALLDATGVFITRLSFESAPDLSPFQGNWLRCVGALIGFVLLSHWIPIRLWSRFQFLDMTSKKWVIFASLLGTFFALSLWITALRLGHLGMIAGIGASGPLFATLLECAVARRWPSLHVGGAIAFFLVGFFLIVQH